jgi:hypothetical protein
MIDVDGGAIPGGSILAIVLDDLSKRLSESEAGKAAARRQIRFSAVS